MEQAKDLFNLMLIPSPSPSFLLLIGILIFNDLSRVVDSGCLLFVLDTKVNFDLLLFVLLGK